MIGAKMTGLWRRRERSRVPRSSTIPTWPLEPEPSGMVFPIGPLYGDMTGGYEAAGWVRYKVLAADWYISALAELTNEANAWDRHMGVEMALDGALNALSGAFDAAVGCLIEAVEEEIQTAADRRIPAHRYSWSRLRSALATATLATQAEIDALVVEIDHALEGEQASTPTGWLAVLRRLRNRPTHRGTLPRVWDVDELDRPSTPTLHLAGNPKPLDYLREAADMVADLTESILKAANHLGWIGPSTTSSRRPWRVSHS
jgi:hypothetical protein